MQKRRLDTLINEAVSLAEDWQNRANELLTHEEKGIQEQMKRLLTNPLDKVVLVKLIDQSFRSHDNDRVADQVNALLRQYGVPDFFSRVERLLIQMFLGVGHHFPALAVPKMIEKMRQSSSRAIISGEPEHLHAHLRKRKSKGVRMNINHLGEAILGEKECRHRLDAYTQDLKNPDIECISVKISTMYSQISSLDFESTVHILKERLSVLYRTATMNYFTCSDGLRIPKFVNLDMEEYRDMEITYNAFIEALDQEEFKNYSAGIVLQAYLPDAHLVQKKLTEWAKKRLDSGGAPVKLRIVKGANLEMERIESILYNWPLAPYDNKLEVDANYKRMVHYGMQPENIRAVHIGIASHNLFELAYAYKLAQAYRVADFFCFELLEGMADHVRRALCEVSGDVLLYAPVATKEEFLCAIAYLIRRLDENTAAENFLRYAPDLRVGSPEWIFLKDQFVNSCNCMEKARLGPNRTQDRNNETFPETSGTFYENEFSNEPDTDWCLPANRRWAKGIRAQWKKPLNHTPVDIPLVVGGSEIFGDREIRDCTDPSQFPHRVVVARCVMGNDEDVDRAIDVAKADPEGWRKKSHRSRHKLLSQVAMEIRRSRGDLIGAITANTGKLFTEADSEVSEAIDITEYYPYSADKFMMLEQLNCKGKGVGVIISSSNFPIAVPCGGVVAALASGNTAILKPSSDAVLAAWELCRCFWKAGISKSVLQFLPCPESRVTERVTSHSNVDFVVLTGGTDIGMRLLEQAPGIDLTGETGGKNATIVTAMADRGQAVKNVISSAFGHSGQKSSATSLLILEKEVYEDPHFKEQLADAARSLCVGSAWEFQSRMPPLICPPGADLKRALTTLDPGESWLLKPENTGENKLIWTPGIKWGVQEGSYTHMTEFLGPLLGVMRAESLEHAISLVNQTGYGLVSAIESLDKREQDVWKDQIKAGTLYINRGTTGAMILRQPFGGIGKSALGPGFKAGGPDYIAQFMHFEDNDYPKIGVIEKDSEILQVTLDWQRKIRWGFHAEHREDLFKTIRAVKSYLFHAEQKFSRDTDYFHLPGQDNILRYLPLGHIVIRLNEQDSLFEVLARIAAARISGCTVTVSIPESIDNRVISFLVSTEGKALLGKAKLVKQHDVDLIDMIPSVQGIRYAAPDRVPEAVLFAAAKIGFYVSRSPVIMEGQIELPHYYRQQTICDTYHRYGNLGARTKKMILQREHDQ